jgi:ribosomal protein S18 acetylase RimI-like enzyme
LRSLKSFLFKKKFSSKKVITTKPVVRNKSGQKVGLDSMEIELRRNPEIDLLGVSKIRRGVHTAFGDVNEVITTCKDSKDQLGYGEIRLAAFPNGTLGKVQFQKILGRPVYLVHNLAVKSFAQKGGIATQLLLETITCIKKEKGVRRIVLHVKRTNTTAQKIYAQLGFKKYLGISYVRLKKGEIQLSLEL